MSTKEQKLKQLESKKKELESKKKELEEKINELKNNSEWIKIPNTDLEIELKVHHKGLSYNDLKKEFGEEYLKEHLPTLKIIAIILENEELTIKLKMDGSSTNDDFYFKQPLKRNESEGLVAYFYANSVGSYLDCDRDSDCSDSYRGVRFVRKVNKK